MVIGAPTAPRRRIIRGQRIVSRGRWIVAVVAVRVIVRVCEDGAEGKSSEPDADGGTRAYPAPTPTPTRICGPRHRRQPDSGKDRRGDGQSPASLHKEPASDHIPSLARRSRAGWLGNLQCWSGPIATSGREITLVISASRLLAS